ncbi:uncharacterized protein KRP23_8106 [Phytophthora ramorum]|uniref:uncharacterized protein n=1 Tax=Phytophthora ramorum TaxID=164328 RepID=UPI00309B96FC|nr:hypothetical protein KRP23_8106 [Phytophthora ramorum]
MKGAQAAGAGRVAAAVPADADAAHSGARAASEQTEGWTTVSNERAQVQGDRNHSKPREGGAANGSGAKQGGASKTSPRKTQRKSKTNGSPSTAKPVQRDGVDPKNDGTAAFQQLRRYLVQGAKQDYVLHTILRLGELAANRRFQSWVSKQTGGDRNEQQLRAE